jgi:hypothetical protein
MTLSCKNQWQKRTYGPGIYINEVEIVAAEDISGAVLPYLERPVDIGVKLTLDIGKEFNPELVIAGNFKRDPDTGEVVGWGSAFVVAEALSRLGHTGPLDEGNGIPPGVLESVIGKRFLRLSYVSGMKQDGRFRYSDWNQIGTLEEGPHALAARFSRSLAKGFPKNYRVEVLTSTTQETSPEPPKEDPF